MKKAIASIAFAAILCSSAHAVDGLSITGSFDFESEYVFRGKRFTQAAIQPSVEIGYSIGPGTAYVGAWTSFPIHGSNNTQENEIDLYAGYALPLSDVFTLDGGFTYYLYSDPSSTNNPVTFDISRAREVYLGVQADVFLEPSIYGYWDFDREQAVVEISIGNSLPLDDYLNLPLSFDTSAHFGYLHADSYNGNQRRGGFSKWKNSYFYQGLSADLVYTVSENVSISAGARFARNNDGTAGGPAGSNPQLGGDSKLWWGASVVLSY